MTFPLSNTEPWMQDALCAQVDADMFYPEKANRAQGAREAKRVCMQCPVRGAEYPEPGYGGTGECLEYALARGERFGIWGGYSERQRLRMKRERRWGGVA